MRTKQPKQKWGSVGMRSLNKRMDGGGMGVGTQAMGSRKIW